MYNHQSPVTACNFGISDVETRDGFGETRLNSADIGKESSPFQAVSELVGMGPSEQNLILLDDTGIGGEWYV